MPLTDKNSSQVIFCSIPSLRSVDTFTVFYYTLNLKNHPILLSYYVAVQTYYNEPICPVKLEQIFVVTEPKLKFTPDQLKSVPEI